MEGALVPGATVGLGVAKQRMGVGIGQSGTKDDGAAETEGAREIKGAVDRADVGAATGASVSSTSSVGSTGHTFAWRIINIPGTMSRSRSNFTSLAFGSYHASVV